MNPQTAVIKTIEKLNYRVTIGDVASQSGLDINLVQTELLNLATLTLGNLQVSETGEVVYVFSPQLENILRNRNFKRQLQAWLAVVWKWLFYLIRISFGILLVASIAIVVIGIGFALVALQSRSDNDSDSSNNSSSSDNSGFFPSFLWFDFANTFNPSSRRSLNSEDPDQGMNFLESIFSFLFGDGNPNFDLETRRNQAIASVIRQNQGVVIAEQVLPYLDVSESLSGSYSEGYEDYIIPVLSKFNGLPQVTNIGTLAYTFPDLQRIAAPFPLAPPDRSDRYLLAQPWQFSKAGRGKITLAIALGISYLTGALILGNLLGQLGANLGGFLGFVAGIYPVLFIYAALFLIIPTVRFIVIGNLNKRIENINGKRATRAAILANPTPELKQKLELAQDFAIAPEIITDQNLVYTTETDLNEQEYAKIIKSNQD
jgi:hypothetical protein